MLAKSPIALLTAALAVFSPAHAAPVQNSTQEVMHLVGDYTFAEAGVDSPFIACLKSKNAYDDDGSMDHDAAIDCRHAFSDHDSTNHQSRSLPSTSETPKKSSCGKEVPNHFMEAAPFREAVNSVCNDLSSKLMDKGLEKGGNAIKHVFGNGYHKKDSWLEDNQKVILELAMNLTPQTRAALKATKVAKATFDTLCKDGLTKLGTKGEGCTQELNYYKGTIGIPGHGIPTEHAQTTTIKDGVSDLFINNAKDFFGTLSMNWRNP